MLAHTLGPPKDGGTGKHYDLKEVRPSEGFSGQWGVPSKEAVELNSPPLALS